MTSFVLRWALLFRDLVDGAMPLPRWPDKLHRARLVFIGACLFLLGGALSPWYRIPPEPVVTFEMDLWLLSGARLLALALAVASAIAAWKPYFIRLVRSFFWIGLILFLSFPYLLIHICPELAFVAKDYFNQGTLVSQHAEQSALDSQKSWKQHTTLVSPIPIESVVLLQVDNSKFFNLPVFIEKIIASVFGYGNSFFLFLSRGWGLSAFGIFAALNASYLSARAEDRLPIFVTDLSRFLPCLGLCIVVSSSISLATNIYDHQLDLALAKGDYRTVITGSQRLRYWNPLFKGDVDFILREAEAQYYDGTSNPISSNLATGLDLYQQNYVPSAIPYFEQVLAVEPNSYIARGYLTNALIEEGITWFDQENPGAAIAYFESALWVYPGHLQALYNLMLAKAITGDFSGSARVSRQLLDVQAYFQPAVLSAGLVGQAYLHDAWSHFHQGDAAAAWRQYLRSTGRAE